MQAVGLTVKEIDNLNRMALQGALYASSSTASAGPVTTNNTRRHATIANPPVHNSSLFAGGIRGLAILATETASTGRRRAALALRSNMLAKHRADNKPKCVPMALQDTMSTEQWNACRDKSYSAYVSEWEKHGLYPIHHPLERDGDGYAPKHDANISKMSPSG